MQFSKSVSYCLVLFFLFLVNCHMLELDNETPTRSRIQGTWEVVEAYDEDGICIMDKLSFPATFFHFSSDNSVVSTAGPLTMHLVYGSARWVEIAAKFDQVFNYAGLDFTGGEWFMRGGNVDRFTLEMKLEGLPGQKSLTELLNILGIARNHLDMVIYHKFMDINISFNFWDRNTMYWDFDHRTFAEYNTKDEYGRYVLWEGVQAHRFSRSRFVLEKRSRDINDLVRMAYEE
ncbi:hypothetical protein CHISP_3095 [Chitinispirillum alkaliphilum]|nr:hypothetical protein CHISP_3095 [Chitinispirillum alkaliphilum]